MVSMLSSFLGIFNREKCQKMINYDGRTLNIKALQVNLPNIPIEIGEIQSKYEKIRDATTIAEALDDYQFQMCKICKALGKDDPQWRNYNELRVYTIQMITSFRLNLIAIKEGAQSKTEEVDKIVEKMREVLKADEQAIPTATIEQVRPKERVSRAEVQDVNTQGLSEAKKNAELDPQELERFLEVLDQKTVQESPKDPDDKTQIVQSLIYQVKEQINKDNIKELSVKESFKKVQPKISQLYQTREYREIIGESRSNDMRHS
jgi:hypothetical protein